MMKSAVFVSCFWLLVIVYAVLAEMYFRVSPAQQSAVTVIWAWLQHGNARVLLSILWLITTLGFISLAADHLRNIYISVTGTPDTYIFLGDKLREGMYVVQEKDPQRKPVFAPYFVVRNQYPAASFGSIYERKVLLRDGEGNLTTAEMFYTGRLILFSFLQLALLLFSVMCVISVADQFIQQFPGTRRINDLALATTVTPEFTKLFFGFLLLIYAGGVALMALNMRSVKNVSGKAMPLPAFIKEGNKLSGKVIASEDYEIDNSKRSTHDARFYRRYTFLFDGAEFPLPVYLNWSKQRIHEGNINVARGNLRKERKQDKDYYDRVFKYLDDSITSGGTVNFDIGEELEVIPLLPDASSQ